MEIYYSIDHLTKKRKLLQESDNYPNQTNFLKYRYMYISLKTKYINYFFKDQKDFYFQLEYLCRNHNFSLEYEMTVFKVSLSCVEPNLIIVTCVSLNLCQK